MKSYAVHYKNKYPDCSVQSSENSLNVYSKDGDHLISLERNGHGQWVDRSEENGCSDKHDLSPIPKETRRFKLYANGMIGKSEEFEERSDFVKKHVKACKHSGIRKVVGKNHDGKCILDESIYEVETEKAPAKKASKK